MLLSFERHLRTRVDIKTSWPQWSEHWTAHLPHPIFDRTFYHSLGLLLQP